jgi:uncharacterized protein YdeI (YjbR/CyaY-like superfamily)
MTASIEESYGEADLADMLKTASPAQEFFAKLSYTNKKESVQWIESAKKQETRHNTIASGNAHTRPNLLAQNSSCQL